MRLFCTLGWHSPGPQILWNAGFWFTKCRDCERDLVRSRHRGWHVPVGAKVVWQTKAPAPRPPVEPAGVVASATPDILVEAGKPPKRVKRMKPADPIGPAHLAMAPEPAALIEAAEAPAPVDIATSAEGSDPSQPLAPAERLDLAQFVAEMLHSAGPAVPIQHAVLGDLPGPLADASEETEAPHATTETETSEALVPDEAGVEAGAEAVLDEAGEATEELGEILVTDASAPLELDEPLELVVDLGLNQVAADQLDMPEEDAPPVDRQSGDAPAEPGDEAELPQDPSPRADAPLDELADPAAAQAEAPLSPDGAEPAPAAPDTPAPAVATDPWADFLDDDDDDDDDFAWAQESPPQSPAASRAASERPMAPRAAPEHPAGGGEQHRAQRLNEPFRSDIDGRKRWSKNSVKR